MGTEYAYREEEVFLAALCGEEDYEKVDEWRDLVSAMEEQITRQLLVGAAPKPSPVSAPAKKMFKKIRVTG